MPSINSTEDLLNLLERNEEFRNARQVAVLFGANYGAA